MFTVNHFLYITSSPPKTNNTSPYLKQRGAVVIMELELSPDHLVDDADVRLDDFHNLCRDVFFDVVGNRNAVVTVLVHGDGGIDCL